MKVRYLRGLALLAVGAVVFSGASALAASPKSAAVDVKFKSGPDSPFGLAGGTRFDGYYVSSMKRVYFLGTRQADDSTSGEVWYYDTAKKKYVDTGVAMQTPVSNYSIAGLTDKTGFGLYIFGGRDANAAIVTDVQVYYPDTNTAAKLGSKDAWPGTTSPSDCPSLPAMGVATVQNTAIVVGGVAFSANGCAGDENSDQTWVFSPKGKAGKKWKAGPPISLARGYVTTAVLGGKLYAIGGDTNDAGVLTAQTTVESFDPTSSSWKKVKDLPEACDETQAFGFDKGPLAGTITVTGCGQWPNDLPDVLQYNSKGKSWSTVGTLLESRRNEAGANIGTDKKPQLFVVGGYGADGATVLETSEIGTVSKAGLQWTRVAPHGASRGATTS